MMALKRGPFTFTSYSLVKRVLSITMLIWVSLFAICYVRFISVKEALPSESCSSKEADFINSTERNLIERLAKAIQFRTISYSQNVTNLTEVARFREYIEKTFPLVHSTPFIKKELVNSHSLLYTVTGSDPALKPYLLSAHLDVVPADEGEWLFPPFEGVVHNGSLYGRGTLDVKNIIMGIMEALEFSLERDFRPKRSFFVAFGHDEEVSGKNGAAHIAALLESRNTQLEFLLDEGLLVIKDMIPGIKEPVAFIGTAEKGYLTVKLSVNTGGGHSSVAPLETAVVILSKALAKLKGNVHASQFGKGPEKAMLEEAAPYASGPYKFVYSNLWLFSPVLSWVFDQNPATSANVRTTTAVTMVGGGLKENVIPTSAWAIVNHRVFPSQSIQEVVSIDRDIIDDHRVKLEPMTAHEAVNMSPYGDDVFGWHIIKRTVRQIYPASPVLPSLMPARTDSSWYTSLTSVIYRFTPPSIHVSDTKLFHGPNEHIKVENYEQVVNFFNNLIQNADSERCQSATTEHQEL